MKRLPLKYFAGLIDGEGCIDFQVTRGVHIRPRLRIALVDHSKFLLDMIENSYGGKIYHRVSSQPNHRDSYSWEVSGYRPACKVLRNVVNNLILKKEQARLCLWMEDVTKGKPVSTEVRDALREELKQMKRDPHRLSEQAQKRISEML